MTVRELINILDSLIDDTAEVGIDSEWTVISVDSVERKRLLRTNREIVVLSGIKSIYNDTEDIKP